MNSRCSIAVAALLLASSPALAGWGPSGATIKATTNSISKIAAGSDGANGSFVVWQEESTPGAGVLRAQHVLATGDIDPAWPADGALICSAVVARPVIAVLSDGLGGAYAWWKEGAMVYLSRFGADGAIAANWPARGRFLGNTYPATARPSVIEDGAHGVYAAWPISTLGSADPMAVVAMHLGPGNTGAGGWPNSARGMAGGDPVATQDFWPTLALAADGGLFVGWASYSSDEGQVASGYHVRRVTSAGLNAAGWDPAGISLGAFHGEWLDSNPETGLIGISADGRGGVFALVGLLTGYNGYSADLETRLFRLDGSGAHAADWPVGGALMSNGPFYYVDAGPDASYRVMADGLDGAQMGVPYFYDHGSSLGVRGASAEGSIGNWFDAQGSIPGTEIVAKGDGGVFLASFYPKGPSGPYEPYAFLQLVQTNAPAGWSDFQELHFDIVVNWYGDIGLASIPGGAVFFWSQVRDQFGLFARRFNSSGEVTSVTPRVVVPSTSLARLRFLPGQGVQASVGLFDDRGARLDLFDLAGRRVATSRLEGLGPGTFDVTVDGSATLPSGLYFARLIASGERRTGKVSIAR